MTKRARVCSIYLGCCDKAGRRAMKISLPQPRQTEILESIRAIWINFDRFAAIFLALAELAELVQRKPEIVVNEIPRRRSNRLQGQCLLVIDNCRFVIANRLHH